MNDEEMFALLKEIIEFRDIRKRLSSKHPELVEYSALVSQTIGGSELHILDHAANYLERKIVASLQDMVSSNEMEQKHMDLLADWTRTKEDYLAILDSKMASYNEVLDVPNNSRKFVEYEKGNCNHV